MKNSSHLFEAIWAFLFIAIICPLPAHAYFDAATGTYIIQVVMGFGAAVWIALRTHAFKLKPPRKDAKPTDESKGEPVGQ